MADIDDRFPDVPDNARSPGSMSRASTHRDRVDGGSVEPASSGACAPAVAPAGGAGRLRRVPGAFAMCVLVALFVWVVFWPQLDGQYTGDAGRLTVDVVHDETGTHVTMKGDAVPMGQQGRLDADRGFTTVSFGTGIARESLVFHPLEGGRYELVSGCRSVELLKSSPGRRFVQAHPYLTVLGFTIVVVFFVGYVLWQKAKSEPEAIFPMWLAFFVALFVSVGVLGWAGNAGMFGFDGVPRNWVADLIVQAAEWFLAVNEECILLLGILAVFVLPQWFAYVFAGFSGAAQRSRFVVFAWKSVALFIAKAFISASAVLLGIDVVGSYYAWLNPNPLNVIANAMLALLLFMIGLAIFCAVPLRKPEGRTVSRPVRRVHKWMRRKLRKPEGAIAEQIEREAREAAQSHDCLPAIPSACGRGQWVWQESRGAASWRRKLFRARRQR